MENLSNKTKPPVSRFCEDCGGTGICGDEGPGRRNARLEWQPCDCPLGEQYRHVRQLTEEGEARLRARVSDLESAADMLNDEFLRIIAIAQDGSTHGPTMEIVGICERALSHVKRSVPLVAECVKQRVRVRELENALNEIYHRSDSTSHQLEIIEAVLPQQGGLSE